MKGSKVVIPVVLLLASTGSSQLTRALSVDIHGKKLIPNRPGEVCLNVAGDYDGFRVEASESTKTPQFCFSSRHNNTLRLQYVTLVATDTSVSERTLRFEHEFSSGPKGLVYARLRLKGFFAKVTGAAVPTGNYVSFGAYFSQGGNDDPIHDGLQHTVGESLDSALLDTQSSKKYLISGKRTLKGVLRFILQEEGDKLVIENETTVVIDRVKNVGEKLNEQAFQ